jgi:Xaa-Pro aminopeptidase
MESGWSTTISDLLDPDISSEGCGFPLTNHLMSCISLYTVEIGDDFFPRTGSQHLDGTLRKVEEVRMMDERISWNIPRFPKEEGARRHREIRADMELRGIDCLVVPGHCGNFGGKAGNFRYVSDYRMWYDDEYIVFPADREGVIFTWSDAHADWANRVSWIPAIFRGGKRNYVNAIVGLIKEMGFDHGTIGLVDMDTLPALIYVGLREGLPNCKMVEAKEVIYRHRIIKSPIELEFVRKSAECADRGWEAMFKAARVGAQDSEVWTACERELILSGSEPPSFSLYASGPWIGRGLGFPYGPNPRVLQQGDLVLNEISPCYGGYFVQLCRPISLGKPDPKFLDAYQLSLEIYHLALEEMKPGVLLREVEAKVIKLANSKGYRSSPNAGLQNCGLDNNERIPKGTVLKPGMTSVIHSWIDHPMTNPNVGGHIIGDTIIIGEKSNERLSKLPLELKIV